MARRCRHVVGIEPSRELFDFAKTLQEQAGLSHLEFRRQSIYEHTDRNSYDLVVLDNVLEHLPDQPKALEIVTSSLRAGGVVYILVPNKLWPIEVHYGLPFLSYLPLRAANWYLRRSGRGTDYTDASYAPTYFSLNRMLRDVRELTFQYVLPAHLEMATGGHALHYRMGVALIRRLPPLWVASKALLVVAQKGEVNSA